MTLGFFGGFFFWGGGVFVNQCWFHLAEVLVVVTWIWSYPSVALLEEAALKTQPCVWQSEPLPLHQKMNLYLLDLN